MAAVADEPFHVLQTGRCCRDSPGFCEVSAESESL
jgi:hypothetical protein